MNIVNLLFPLKCTLEEIIATIKYVSVNFVEKLNINLIVHLYKPMKYSSIT